MSERPNRVPKRTPGKIKFRWAKGRDENPDWWATWEQPADRGTCNLILQKIPELAEELVRRGYDRNSIRFECKRTTPQP